MLRCLVIVSAVILTFVILNNISPTSCLYAGSINSSVSLSSPLSSEQGHDELQDILFTEKILVDTLRHYIETQEHKLEFLKRNYLEIRDIHDGATDRKKYLYNPINALIILKRFTADWKILKSYAEDYLQTDDLIKNYTQQKETLVFPTGKDYDEALINLLRIQDIYQLEPRSLAVGEVNGVKLGSDMSWSDCLEIGLKSSKNGYQNYAKYWMETAFEKLPNGETTNNRNNNKNSSEANEINNLATATKQGHKSPPQADYMFQAKLEIMKALLNIEYKLGNFKEALKMANEMLQLQPKRNNLINLKNRVEKLLKLQNKSKKNKTSEHVKDKQKTKITKTAEELLIEEICREASRLQANKQIHTASTTFATTRTPSITHPPSCAVTTGNTPYLFLLPLKLELLSLDPYIVMYHNVLSDTKLEELKDLVDEKHDGRFELTKIGHKKMRQFNGKLHYLLGHYKHKMYDNWQVEKYDFENLMELSNTLINHGTVGQAKLLLNLQESLMGGSVIFPQLELSINLPRGSILYFSTLDEFHAPDYRSKYHVCPVIAGVQITAFNTIKNI